MPQHHFVETDAGVQQMQLIRADPLIMRVPDFLSASEISTLLASVGISSSRSMASAGASDPWTRYEPFLPSVQHNAVSSDASMLWNDLSGSLSLLPTLQRRIATLCQVKQSHVTQFQKVIRYQPGQEFKLHSVCVTCSADVLLPLLS